MGMWGIGIEVPRVYQIEMAYLGVVLCQNPQIQEFVFL